MHRLRPDAHMFDHVLVAVDGSDCSAAATREAVAVAEARDARLSLLHVLTRAGVENRGVDPDDAPEASLHRFAEAELREAEEAASAADVTVETRVRVGDPVETILDSAGDADLLAAGTHGRTGVRRLLLGSVAERLVRRSPVPVLTTRERRPETTDRYREILLPTDGSEAGLAAAERKLDFARAFDARVHALYVVDRRLLSNQRGPVRSASVERLQTRGTRVTAAIAERAADRGLEADTAVVEGIPRTEIRTYAETHRVDLVAMGTQGRTGTDRWLSGSVAESVLRTSPAPVLTVRYESGSDAET